MKEKVREDLNPEDEKKLEELSEQASKLAETAGEVKDKVKEAAETVGEKAKPLTEKISETIDDIKSSEAFQEDPEAVEARLKQDREMRQAELEAERKQHAAARERQEKLEKMSTATVESVERATEGTVVGSFFSKVKKEYTHASEYLRKKGGRERFRRRSVEDRQSLSEQMEKGEIEFTHPEYKPPEKEVEEVDTSEMTEEELEAYEAKVKEEEEEQDRINATGLVAMGDEETVWEKRLDSMRESFRKTAPMKKLRSLRREAEVSDNEVITKLRDIKYDVEDSIEDAKETYETSQHPLIWRVRDANDALFNETEQGWAMGELMKIDSAFDEALFLEDMEEYMIPVVVEAFMKPNMALLQSVTEENAARVVFASTREREVTGHYWDTRILDISHIDMIGAVVEDGTPYVTLTFVCQHVHCVRDKKGKIVEGSESELKNMFYVWKVRRDYENPHFDWKITELGFQRLFALV